MQTPTPGRIVNLVMKDGSTRAMIVTCVFAVSVAEGAPPHPPMVNGTVFIDGHNDLARPGKESVLPDMLDVSADGMLARAWSRNHSDQKEPGTWHWPERV